MKDKLAREMYRAAVKALGRLPALMRKSITYNNSLENALRLAQNHISASLIIVGRRAA
ncbi:MAG: hypothetical protein LBD37_10335 [Treponema sp.]|nr:hypothetical protein [Treponema sp.]